MKSSGYSGTPLAKKLGIKDGAVIFVDGEPDHYRSLLAPMPDGVVFASTSVKHVDNVHLFTKSASTLGSKLAKFIPRIEPNGMIWVFWPKQASRVPTDVTEDIIRDIALPLGLVDVKVCSVDDTWSGLKLVLRIANRKR